MSPKSRTDLSRKDINFLRVVRAVCDNPEEFRGTDGGIGPATVTAVAEASNLSKEQVRYRMREGSRGLGGSEARRRCCCGRGRAGIYPYLRSAHD